MPIYLRALEPEDLELLYTIENAPDLWAVNSNVEPYSRFALRKYIAEQPNDIFQTGSMRLIICRKSDDAAIGIVGAVVQENKRVCKMYAPILLRVLRLCTRHREQSYRYYYLPNSTHFAKSVNQLQR